MRPGKQEGLTPSVFRFGLIGMFGISEPGRDSSPLTGLTTIPAHCSLNNTAIPLFCHFAQEIVLKGLMNGKGTRKMLSFYLVLSYNGFAGKMRHYVYDYSD